MRPSTLCRSLAFTALAAIAIRQPLQAAANVALHTAEPSTDSPAREILEHAMAGDRAVREQSLAQLDALLTHGDKDAVAHYARGWILSHLGRSEEALKAYDRAFQLDPTMAEAPYNAGVVLSRDLHRDKDATVQFDRALKVDPKLIDAAYNAGQSYYNLKDFNAAAERWKVAAALAPEDFQTAKKLVQAYRALGSDAEAGRWRDRVFALRLASTDPNVKKLKDYVFDQFDVGKHKVFAAESFNTSGSLAYLYRFDVYDGSQRLGSVNLETSDVIREAGVPFLLGMDKGSTHSQLGPAWKVKPTYAELKPLVVKAIAEHF